MAKKKGDASGIIAPNEHLLRNLYCKCRSLPFYTGKTDRSVLKSDLSFNNIQPGPSSLDRTYVGGAGGLASGLVTVMIKIIAWFDEYQNFAVCNNLL